ncbi:Ubiquinone biosynthesis protein [Hirschfeldia incana]|nr:Ubiquinone biosynthesis protein [Hirschfeldia incana]
MYRTAAKRLLGAGFFTTTRLLRLPKPRPIPTNIIPYTSSLCTSSMNHTESPPIGNQSVNPNQPNPTSASSSSTAREEGPRRDDESSRKPRAEFQEEQARVLAASLRHVARLGWTEEAMIAGSREVGVSPSIVGSFSRKEAALVEYFMDECLQLLIDRVDSGLDLQNLIPSERVSKLIRIRLEMQIPYMSKWPQALSIQAHPVNVPTSFKQRAMLVDEIWHTVGDGASDLDWYVKRTVLGGVYSTTEIYMLTDDSPEYRDTWAFLDDRVKDAFDLKKSIQEAKYFAQDIGAGVGKSVQGLMSGVMQTMSRRGGSSAF